MRVTILIDDDLLRRAKALAFQSGKTLDAVVDDALRQEIDRTNQEADAQGRLLVYGGVGLANGVDLDSSAQLLETMDDDEPLDRLR